MVIREAYLDESGTHSRKGIIVLGGFMASLEEWGKFNSGLLDRLQARADTFHSTKSSPDDRLTVAKLIAETVEYGFVVSINQAEYISATSARFRSQWGSPYTLAMKEACAQAAMIADHKEITGKIQYVFDGGHRNRGQLNTYLHNVLNHWPLERAKLRFLGWTFGSDAEYLPLKAADLLVFEHLKYMNSGATSPALNSILGKCTIYRVHIDGVRAVALTEQLRQLYQDAKDERKYRRIQ